MSDKKSSLLHFKNKFNIALELW